MIERENYFRKACNKKGCWLTVVVVVTSWMLLKEMISKLEQTFLKMIPSPSVIKKGSFERV